MFTKEEAITGHMAIVAENLAHNLGLLNTKLKLVNDSVNFLGDSSADTDPSFDVDDDIEFDVDSWIWEGEEARKIYPESIKLLARLNDLMARLEQGN